MIEIRVRTPSLDRLKRLFGDATAVNAKIANALLSGVRRQFDTHGRHFSGRGWPPYSNKTLYAKRIRGPQGRMLEGLLRRMKIRYGRSFAAVYADSKIAAYHEEGTWDGGNLYEIPARPGIVAYPDPNGKPVRWASGLWRVAKWVGHPGVRQRKMLPTTEQAKALARHVVQMEIHKETG